MWLRAAGMRGRLEREMHEEMQAHLAQAAERFTARGMSRSDAVQAARREFGHVSALQEDARDARGAQWVDHLARDLKYALRHFARTPLTTITIVFTLALGIGFSSAVFSVINGIMTQPAPGVPNDPSLVKIRGIATVRPFDRHLAYSELAGYAALTDQFASVVGWITTTVIVDGGDANGPATSARAYFSTPNYFGTLGVKLAAGRGFDQSRFDDLSPPELTTIVSHALAMERFGDPRMAIGKVVKLNDVAVTIVGVAPPEFTSILPAREPRTLWVPLSALSHVTREDGRLFSDPNARRFEAFARLRPGVSLADAVPAVRVVAARADAAARSEVKREWTGRADIVPLRGISMKVTGRYERELGPGALLFAGIALIVLLLCTTTVNSLLIGSALTRRYEIGVRLALGASRSRVVRQLLTEVAILALTGGALGMWAFGALARLTEVAQDGFDVSPTWATIGFTTLYALVTATLCGLSPALHATRAGLSDVLKDSSSGTKARSRLQRVFVVAQIAVAQPLMIGLAAMLAHSITELSPYSNLTLRDRVVMAELDASVDFALHGHDRIPDIMQRLTEVPGVEAVRRVGWGQGSVSLELSDNRITSGRDVAPAQVRVQLFDVPPDFFGAVDVPIVRGRDFAAADTALPVTPVIMAESLAVAMFKTRDPIGQRLRTPAPAGGKPWEVEVVGVARVRRETSFWEFEPDYPPVFVPLGGRAAGGCVGGPCGTLPAKILIRTTGPAEPLLPTLSAAVREQARTVPVTRIQTLAQHDRWYRQTRVGAAGAAAMCGAIALILASVGLYAMVAIAVGQRRREIGVRVALGAHPRAVVRMFLRSGLRATIVGLGIGLPISVAALIALMRGLGVPWGNVPALALLVTLTVAGVAAFASWLPARRAATVDPMTALRPV
jgi:predicted permease